MNLEYVYRNNKKEVNNLTLIYTETIQHGDNLIINVIKNITKA